MDSKLRKHYEKILCALDEALQNVDDEIKNEYELVITPANFVPRSPISKAAYQLMTTLNNKDADLKTKIFAAQGLLKLGYYQEQAIEFLGNAIVDRSITEMVDIKERTELLANVMEALGEASSHAQNNSNLPDDAPLDCSTCRRECCQ